MLIIGAGGLAAQLFDDLIKMESETIVFWSETGTKYTFISDKFSIIQSDKEVVHYFNTVSRSCILCVSGTDNRKRLAQKFEQLGGDVISFISPASFVSSYITLGLGSMILTRAHIEPGVTIGEKCLINGDVRIGHGCVVGSYCEICPGVILTGEVTLGEGTYVGTGAIILPKVKIGNNVTIAAGAIVKKNVPDNGVVAGEFATVKFFKKLKPGL